jgi:hypothetical protein
VGPANQALAAELAKQPVLPEPKWWQRLAGAGAGAAAGYSNAAGRTRNPIDLNELSQNILAPGYGQKLAEWKSRVAPLQQAAETETARNQAWWKNAGTAADIAYKKAHADYMEGLGRTPPLVEVTPEMAAASGDILKVGSKIPSSTATELVRVAAGKYEKPEKTMVVTDPGLASVMGVKPGTAVPNSLYQAAVGVNNKEHNTSEWQSYLDANGGDPAKALRAQQADKVRVAHEMRTPAAGNGAEVSTPPPASDLPRLKAIANGDIPAPSPRSKNYNQTMDWVYQIDPTYTEGRYLGKKNFQNSKDAQNLGTITRIMGHLDRFDKNSSALGFSPLLGTNTTGAQRRLHIVSNAIAEEFGKLVSGGVLTQDQAKRSEANLLSPIESVRKDALDEVNQLMDSQFEGIYQRYRAATNQDFPTGKYFDNATRQRLQKRGSLPSSSGQSGTGPGEAAQAVPQDAMVTATLPDGRTGKIHASQADQFIKDHPGAKVK